MEKEYNRSSFVKSFVESLGFSIVRPDLYEKKINWCSKFRAEYRDYSRSLIFTYFISLGVKCDGLEKVAYAHYKISYFDLCNLVDIDGKNHLKRIMLDMVNKVHNKILFNNNDATNQV